jgi:hypothetical protein
MIEPQLPVAMLQGCDASHRASNLDTHLTHGCIQLFRQFSRVRKGRAELAEHGIRTFQPLSEGALRTLAETVA